MTTPTCTCIIPARGGSKRIPRKNLKIFCGKPMIVRAIETALDSGIFDRVVVSSDDAAIQLAAREAGAETPFDRPAMLADDHATTDKVLLHALEALNLTGGLACCLYATAPFVLPEDLVRGRDILLAQQADSVLTMTRFSTSPYRALVMNEQQRVEFLWPEYRLTRSQDLPETWMDAGQFYWVNVARYRVEKKLFGPHTCAVEMPSWRVQDIDTEEDWIRAERMFQALPGSPE